MAPEHAGTTVTGVATSAVVADNRAMTDEQLPSSARRVVLAPRVFSLLMEMCAAEGEDKNDVATRAVRDLLKREGYWRPGPNPTTSADAQ
jgi:hypothetical protein